VAVADFNGETVPDVVTANRFSDDYDDTLLGALIPSDDDLRRESAWAAVVRRRAEFAHTSVDTSAAVVVEPVPS
jgi:hypothetical protein